jgi:hypothetical protein
MIAPQPLALPPALHCEIGIQQPGITALGWDGEGGGRERLNLLRTQRAVGLRFEVAGRWHDGADLPSEATTAPAGGRSFRIQVASDAVVSWTIRSAAGGLRLEFAGSGAGLAAIGACQLVFPFDPGQTPVCVLPSAWTADGGFTLPAVVSAPDRGQLLLTASSTAAGRQTVLTARLDGSRKEKKTDLVLTLAPPVAGIIDSLVFAPQTLPPPSGLADQVMWKAVRRGWANAWQASSRWGDQGNPYSAPAGMLANNVISDPASCSLWFYADQLMWTPEIAPGVSLLPTLRRTLDFWLDQRIRPDGEMVCYWDYGGFLDANAGPLIAAWDYVEAGGDPAWLRDRIGKLELVADYLARRDVDGDGLVEAVQSGNRGTLLQPGRSCAWWDALNCGHQDGYTNALIDRAWRCLAELEGKLGRAPEQARYRGLADRLKAAYAPALFNPATGWLAWWKSADGQLHDYASTVVNGLAIEYGLIEPAQGRAILARLRAKMAEVGFSRFDLGMPPMLLPVRREDYLLPDAFGCPKREDGTDTVGQYMNGGISAGQVLHFLAAHYVVGDPAPADAILTAMLERLGRGEFHNGVRDAGGEGIDWTTWDGRPSGYEGYLADSFRFLQAALLREAPFRARLYRPLTAAPETTLPE